VTLVSVDLTAPFVNAHPKKMSWVEMEVLRDAIALDVVSATTQQESALASLVTTVPSASNKPSFIRLIALIKHMSKLNETRYSNFHIQNKNNKCDTYELILSVPVGATVRVRIREAFRTSVAYIFLNFSIVCVAWELSVELARSQLISLRTSSKLLSCLILS
jgi:hypothetical protein